MPENTPPTPLKVYAAPISTFSPPVFQDPQKGQMEGGPELGIRPEDAARPGQIVARAAASLGSSSAQIAVKERDFQQQQDMMEGAARRYELQLSYAEAVEQKKINPEENPYLAKGYVDADASVAAEQFVSRVRTEVNALWENGDKGIHDQGGYDRVVAQVRSDFLLEYNGSDAWNKAMMQDPAWGQRFGAQTSQALSQTREWHQRKTAQHKMDVMSDAAESFVYASMAELHSNLGDPGAAEGAENLFIATIEGHVETQQGMLGRKRSRELILDTLMAAALKSDDPQASLDAIGKIRYGQKGENDLLVNWKDSESGSIYWNVLRARNQDTIRRATATATRARTFREEKQLTAGISSFVQDHPEMDSEDILNDPAFWKLVNLDPNNLPGGDHTTFTNHINKLKDEEENSSDSLVAVRKAIEVELAAGNDPDAVEIAKAHLGNTATDLEKVEGEIENAQKARAEATEDKVAVEVDDFLQGLLQEGIAPANAGQHFLEWIEAHPDAGKNYEDLRSRLVTLRSQNSDIPFLEKISPIVRGLVKEGKNLSEILSIINEKFPGEVKRAQVKTMVQEATDNGGSSGSQVTNMVRENVDSINRMLGPLVLNSVPVPEVMASTIELAAQGQIPSIYVDGAEHIGTATLNSDESGLDIEWTNGSTATIPFKKLIDDAHLAEFNRRGSDDNDTAIADTSSLQSMLRYSAESRGWVHPGFTPRSEWILGQSPEALTRSITENPAAASQMMDDLVNSYRLAGEMGMDGDDLEIFGDSTDLALLQAVDALDAPDDLKPTSRIELLRIVQERKGVVIETLGAKADYYIRRLHASAATSDVKTVTPSSIFGGFLHNLINPRYQAYYERKIRSGLLNMALRENRFIPYSAVDVVDKSIANSSEVKDIMKDLSNGLKVNGTYTIAGTDIPHGYLRNKALSFPDDDGIPRTREHTLTNALRLLRDDFESNPKLYAEWAGDHTDTEDFVIIADDRNGMEFALFNIDHQPIRVSREQLKDLLDKSVGGKLDELKAERLSRNFPRTRGDIRNLNLGGSP